MRLTHLPTGMRVESNSDYFRSETKMRRQLRKILRSRVAAGVPLPQEVLATVSEADPVRSFDLDDEGDREKLSAAMNGEVEIGPASS